MSSLPAQSTELLKRNLLRLVKEELTKKKAYDRGRGELQEIWDNLVLLRAHIAHLQKYIAELKEEIGENESSLKLWEETPVGDTSDAEWAAILQEQLAQKEQLAVRAKELETQLTGARQRVLQLSMNLKAHTSVINSVTLGSTDRISTIDNGGAGAAVSASEARVLSSEAVTARAEDAYALSVLSDAYEDGHQQPEHQSMRSRDRLMEATKSMAALEGELLQTKKLLEDAEFGANKAKKIDLLKRRDKTGAMGDKPNPPYTATDIRDAQLLHPRLDPLGGAEALADLIAYGRPLSEDLSRAIASGDFFAKRPFLPPKGFGNSDDNDDSDADSSDGGGNSSDNNSNRLMFSSGSSHKTNNNFLMSVTPGGIIASPAPSAKKKVPPKVTVEKISLQEALAFGPHSMRDADIAMGTDLGHLIAQETVPPRMNGEEPKKYLKRLKRRLRLIRNLENQMQDDIEGAMSFVQRARHALRDLEVQRLRVEVKLRSNIQADKEAAARPPGISSSRSEYASEAAVRELVAELLPENPESRSDNSADPLTIENKSKSSSNTAQKSKDELEKEALLKNLEELRERLAAAGLSENAYEQPHMAKTAADLSALGPSDDSAGQQGRRKSPGAGNNNNNNSSSSKPISRQGSRSSSPKPSGPVSSERSSTNNRSRGGTPVRWHEDVTESRKDSQTANNNNDRVGDQPNNPDGTVAGPRPPSRDRSRSASPSGRSPRFSNSSSSGRSEPPVDINSRPPWSPPGVVGSRPDSRNGAFFPSDGNGTNNNSMYGSGPSSSRGSPHSPHSRGSSKSPSPSRSSSRSRGRVDTSGQSSHDENDEKGKDSDLASRSAPASSLIPVDPDKRIKDDNVDMNANAMMEDPARYPLATSYPSDTSRSPYKPTARSGPDFGSNSQYNHEDPSHGRVLVYDEEGKGTTSDWASLDETQKAAARVLMFPEDPFPPSRTNQFKELADWSANKSKEKSEKNKSDSRLKLTYGPASSSAAAVVAGPTSGPPEHPSYIVTESGKRVQPNKMGPYKPDLMSKEPFTSSNANGTGTDTTDSPSNQAFWDPSLLIAEIEREAGLVQRDRDTISSALKRRDKYHGEGDSDDDDNNREEAPQGGSYITNGTPNSGKKTPGSGHRDLAYRFSDLTHDSDDDGVNTPNKGAKAGNKFHSSAVDAAMATLRAEREATRAALKARDAAKEEGKQVGMLPSTSSASVTPTKSPKQKRPTATSKAQTPTDTGATREDQMQGDGSRYFRSTSVPAVAFGRTISPDNKKKRGAFPTSPLPTGPLGSPANNPYSGSSPLRLKSGASNGSKHTSPERVFFPDTSSSSGGSDDDVDNRKELLSKESEKEKGKKDHRSGDDEVVSAGGIGLPEPANLPPSQQELSNQTHKEQSAPRPGSMTPARERAPSSIISSTATSPRASGPISSAVATATATGLSDPSLGFGSSKPARRPGNNALANSGNAALTSAPIGLPSSPNIKNRGGGGALGGSSGGSGSALSMPGSAVVPSSSGSGGGKEALRRTAAEAAATMGVNVDQLEEFMEAVTEYLRDNGVGHPKTGASTRKLPRGDLNTAATAAAAGAGAGGSRSGGAVGPGHTPPRRNSRGGESLAVAPYHNGMGAMFSPQQQQQQQVFIPHSLSSPPPFGSPTTHNGPSSLHASRLYNPNPEMHHRVDGFVLPAMPADTGGASVYAPTPARAVEEYLANRAAEDAKQGRPWMNGMPPASSPYLPHDNRSGTITVPAMDQNSNSSNYMSPSMMPPDELHRAAAVAGQAILEAAGMSPSPIKHDPYHHELQPAAASSDPPPTSALSLADLSSDPRSPIVSSTPNRHNYWDGTERQPQALPLSSEQQLIHNLANSPSPHHHAHHDSPDEEQQQLDHSSSSSPHLHHHHHHHHHHPISEAEQEVLDVLQDRVNHCLAKVDKKLKAEAALAVANAEADSPLAIEELEKNMKRFPLTLEVTVRAARNLPGKVTSKSCDPFVEVQLLHEFQVLPTGSQTSEEDVTKKQQQQEKEEEEELQQQQQQQRVSLTQQHPFSPSSSGKLSPMSTSTAAPATFATWSSNNQTNGVLPQHAVAVSTSSPSMGVGLPVPTMSGSRRGRSSSPPPPPPPPSLPAAPLPASSPAAAPSSTSRLIDSQGPAAADVNVETPPMITFKTHLESVHRTEQEQNTIHPNWHNERVSWPLKFSFPTPFAFTANDKGVSESGAPESKAVEEGDDDITSGCYNNDSKTLPTAPRWVVRFNVRDCEQPSRGPMLIPAPGTDPVDNKGAATAPTAFLCEDALVAQVAVCITPALLANVFDLVKKEQKALSESGMAKTASKPVCLTLAKEKPQISENGAEVLSTATTAAAVSAAGSRSSSPNGKAKAGSSSSGTSVSGTSTFSAAQTTTTLGGSSSSSSRHNNNGSADETGISQTSRQLTVSSSNAAALPIWINLHLPIDNNKSKAAKRRRPKMHSDCALKFSLTLRCHALPTHDTAGENSDADSDSDLNSDSSAGSGGGSISSRSSYSSYSEDGETSSAKERRKAASRSRQRKLDAIEDELFKEKGDSAYWLEQLHESQGLLSKVQKQDPLSLDEWVTIDNITARHRSAEDAAAAIHLKRNPARQKMQHRARDDDDNDDDDDGGGNDLDSQFDVAHIGRGEYTETSVDDVEYGDGSVIGLPEENINQSSRQNEQYRSRSNSNISRRSSPEKLTVGTRSSNGGDRSSRNRNNKPPSSYKQQQEELRSLTEEERQERRLEVRRKLKLVVGLHEKTRPNSKAAQEAATAAQQVVAQVWGPDGKPIGVKRRAIPKWRPKEKRTDRDDYEAPPPPPPTGAPMSFADLIAASKNQSQQPSAEKSANKKASSPLRTPTGAVHDVGDSGLYGRWGGSGRGGKTERVADSSTSKPARKRPNSSSEDQSVTGTGSPVNLSIFRGAGNSLANSRSKVKQKDPVATERHAFAFGGHYK